MNPSFTSVESRIRLLWRLRENPVLCHGLDPWCLTFAATQGGRDGFEDTTRLPGGGSCCLLVGPKTVSVKLHGTSPWHHCDREDASLVAANLTLHRTSLWYREEFSQPL